MAISNLRTHDEATTLPMFSSSFKYTQHILGYYTSEGIGINAIHISQHTGVAVSTSDPNKLVCRSRPSCFCNLGNRKEAPVPGEFGIPCSHTFNSKSIVFAADLLRAIGGEVVDVIFDSSIGDLLDES